MADTCARELVMPISRMEPTLSRPPRSHPRTAHFHISASIRSTRIMQKSSVDKTSAAWDWTPPFPSTGTVTLWVSVTTAYGGDNYEVKLEIPEIPGATAVAVPSASPSAPPRTNCSLFHASRAPSPSASPVFNNVTTTVTTQFVAGNPWAGSISFSSIHLSWVVRPAEQEIDFFAWYAGAVYLAFAFADRQQMTYPVSGLATVGSCDAGVTQVLMTGYSAKNMYPGPPVLKNTESKLMITGYTNSSKTVNGTKVWTLHPNYNTTMRWTRPWNTWVCEDKVVDVNHPVGMIWAHGQPNTTYYTTTGCAFADHGGNDGFIRFRLINTTYVPPSASPTPSVSTTATPSRSLSSTPSNTPSPSASMQIASGGGSDGMSGSVMMSDVSVSWWVRPEANAVDFSMSAAGRVWLSLARASSLSMLSPNAGAAIVGIPGAAGTGTLSCVVRLDVMAGYAVQQFTSIAFAGSGVSNAVCVFDGVRTVFNFTRSYAAIGSGDLAVDPTQGQGFIYARGFTEAYNGHEVRGYAVMRMQTSAPGGSPLPSPSVQPSPSVTPSPSSSAVVASGGGADGLSGSTTMDDIALSWAVRPSDRQIDLSVSASGRVWLSVARSDKNSMLSPNAGLAAVCIPGPAGSGTGGSTFRLDRMGGYDVRSFTPVAIAGSGLLNMQCAYDGATTMFNFSRPFDALGGSASGDLAVDPTAVQGWIYAHGFQNGAAYDLGHQVRGYRTLRMQTGGGGNTSTSTCSAATCNYHGTCTPTGASTCACSAAYAGDNCDSCASLYSRSALAGAGSSTNFTCTVNAIAARAVFTVALQADTGVVGVAGSVARNDIVKQLASKVGGILSNVSSTRIVVTVIDSSQRRALASSSLPASAARALVLQALSLNVSIGPTVDPTQTSSADAAQILASQATTPGSRLLTDLASLGFSVPVSAVPDVGYQAEAAPSLCDITPGGCTFPFAIQLRSDMAMAWRIDDATATLHLQLAYTVPDPSQQRWFGIAFSDSKSMVGGDSIAFEPGQPAGMQVGRYALTGYTINSCPGVNDGTLAVSYSSYKEFSGLLAPQVNSNAHPAAMKLLTAATASSVTILATASRKLHATTAGAGMRSIDAVADVFVTYAWGPPGQLKLSAHTASMSGYTRVNLATGQVVNGHEYSALLVAMHAIPLLVALSVLMPFGAMVARHARDPSAVPLTVGGDKHGNVLLMPSEGPFAWWRRAHSQASWAAAALVVIGSAVGVAMTPSADRFSSAHGKLGLAILVLMLVLSTLSIERVRVVVLGEGVLGLGAAGRGGSTTVKASWMRSHALLGITLLILTPLAALTGVGAAAIHASIAWKSVVELTVIAPFIIATAMEMRLQLRSNKAAAGSVARKGLQHTRSVPNPLVEGGLISMGSTKRLQPQFDSGSPAEKDRAEGHVRVFSNASLRDATSAQSRAFHGPRYNGESPTVIATASETPRQPRSKQQFSMKALQSQMS